MDSSGEDVPCVSYLSWADPTGYRTEKAAFRRLAEIVSELDDLGHSADLRVVWRTWYEKQCWKEGDRNLMVVGKKTIQKEWLSSIKEVLWYDHVKKKWRWL